MSRSKLFETTRLIVRQIDNGDAEAMQLVYGDKEAMRWVGDGEPLDIEGCRHWIEVTRRNYATRGYGMSAIESAETGEVIGFIGLVHPGGQDEPEVKYALRQEFWGQGYASEVVPAMLDHGHNAWGMDEIIATIHPENAASERVLTKSGMTLREVRTEDDGLQTKVMNWIGPKAVDR